MKQIGPNRFQGTFARAGGDSRLEIWRAQQCLQRQSLYSRSVRPGDAIDALARSLSLSPSFSLFLSLSLSLSLFLSFSLFLGPPVVPFYPVWGRVPLLR